MREVYCVNKKGSHLRKAPVLIVFVLFIGTCIFSSTDVKPEEKFSFDKNQESSYSSHEMVNNGKIAYAYCAYDPSGQLSDCTVYFDIDDPGTVEKCGDSISSDFLVGGTIFTDELWYGTQYGDGILYGIDPETCDMWYIGGGGVGSGDIAWDDWTGKLYSAGMMGLAFNNKGICYGINRAGSKFNLYIVEFEPYKETLIGQLINFTSGYGLNAEFDKDTNILYITSSEGLFSCNIETRECNFIGSTGGIELTALAIPYEEYDTTPFTEISFDPPIPDGENGWYISNVTATLTPIGFVNGVEVTYYRINGAEWKTYDNPFTIIEEGDDILVEYYSVDNNGTVEDVKSATIDIDKTPPIVELIWEIVDGNPKDGWEIIFTVNSNDNCSGLVRVEFYINGELQHSVEGPGPYYVWSFRFFSLDLIRLIGLICNLEITDENVSFLPIFVKATEIIGLKLLSRVCVYDGAGNIGCNETIIKRSLPIKPGYYMFKKLTLPNNYSGYIGRFIIFADF
jgi:hypothetical protein